MKMKNPQKLIAWLQYLDVEYVNDDLSEQLSKLNINDPTDQEAIIKMAILPEFITLNETSKKSMRLVLQEIDDYPESVASKVVERVGMPFTESLVDYRAFFDRIRVCLFPDAPLEKGQVKNGADSDDK